MTDPVFPITIYHNPACGTSRNALAIIRGAGFEPSVVNYLQSGWTPNLIASLLKAMGISARELMREKGTPATDLGLLSLSVGEAEIIAAMVAHPILVNRPIVVTPLGAKLCRPSEVVATLLDRKPDRFTKEDGEVVRLSDGGLEP